MTCSNIEIVLSNPHPLLLLFVTAAVYRAFFPIHPAISVLSLLYTVYGTRYTVYDLQERNSAVVVLLPDEAGWRSKDVRVFADEISFFNQVKNYSQLHSSASTLHTTLLYCPKVSLILLASPCLQLMSWNL